METGQKPLSSAYGVKSTFIQLGLCIFANIAQLSAGMSLGFSAVTLPYMQQKESYIHVTSEQASWVAGLAAITVPIGCLISGPVLDRWGRKTGLLLINVPSLVGWLLIAIQPNLLRLYVGRGLTGLATGLACVPATVYFAEISTKSMRGLLINGTSVSIGTGALIVYILGYCFKDDWRMIAGICAAFPATAAVLVAVFIPESPQWLISKGHNKKAYRSLQIIRGVSSTKEIQEEINTMLNQSNVNRKNKLSFKETINSFKCPEVYKPFVIMVAFFFFQQFSGIFVIIFYAVEVVQNSGITFDPFMVSIMIGLVRVIFTILAAWMTKKYGRRLPSILSGIGMTVSLFVLIFYLHFENPNTTVVDSSVNASSIDSSDLNSTHSEVAGGISSVSWVPLLSMLSYVLASTIGFLTLPWAIIGEVFPTRVRGVAGGLTTCVAYTASFVIVKSYPFLLETLHQSGVYMIFGVTAFFGTIFVIFFLPETQGKTLQEIEQYFSKKDSRREFIHDEDSNENRMMLSAVKQPVIQPKT